jgi:hypothetical protein
MYCITHLREAEQRERAVEVERGLLREEVCELRVAPHRAAQVAALLVALREQHERELVVGPQRERAPHARLAVRHVAEPLDDVARARYDRYF